MNSLTGWFVVGIVVVILGASYAPKVIGPVVVLVAIVLALRLAKEKNFFSSGV